MRNNLRPVLTTSSIHAYCLTSVRCIKAAVHYAGKKSQLQNAWYCDLSKRGSRKTNIYCGKISLPRSPQVSTGATLDLWGKKVFVAAEIVP